MEMLCAGSHAGSPHHQGQRGQERGRNWKPPKDLKYMPPVLGPQPRAPGVLPSLFRGGLPAPCTLKRTRSCSMSPSVVLSSHISFTKATEKIHLLLSLAGRETQAEVTPAEEVPEDTAHRQRTSKEWAEQLELVRSGQGVPGKSHSFSWSQPAVRALDTGKKQLLEPVGNLEWERGER